MTTKVRKIPKMNEGRHSCENYCFITTVPNLKRVASPPRVHLEVTGQLWWSSYISGYLYLLYIAFLLFLLYNRVRSYQSFETIYFKILNESLKIICYKKRAFSDRIENHCFIIITNTEKTPSNGQFVKQTLRIGWNFSGIIWGRAFGMWIASAREVMCPLPDHLL